MKRKIIMMLLCMTIVTVCMSACGKKQGQEQETTEVERKTLKVGMECDSAPYNWTQLDGENGAVLINGSQQYAYGYDVKMALKIAENLGYNLEIEQLDWDSMISAVQNGTVDCVIGGQSMTPERKEVVDFTNPYYYADVVILLKKDSAYAQAGQISDLEGAKVTSQSDTVWYDNCLKQIPNADILSGEKTVTEMIKALDEDKCDLVVTDKPTGMAALNTHSDMIMIEFTGTDGDFTVSDDERNIGISVKKGNTELKDAINGVLAEMTKEDYERMMNDAVTLQPLKK